MKPDSSRRYLLCALMAVCVARLWVMPLGSSFWVDETATAFVVSHGAHDPSFAVAPQVPMSIYYVLPRTSTRIFGRSEAAYRLPSLAALALAVWLIGRLAARLIHAEAGWFAAFACLALKGFDYEAADARPYALGTAVACAAVWFLVRWLDEARWRDAALFAAAAALLWRVHLLYWPFYGVLAVYTAARLTRRETRVTWGAAAAVYAAVGLAVVPVAAQVWSLRGEAGAHVMAAPPGARALADSLKLALVAAAGAGAWAWAGRRKRGNVVSLTVAVLCAAWWIGTPAALFAFSRIGGASVFLERYLTLALPGAALAATAVAAVFLPASQWRNAAAVLGAGVLLLLGRWGVLWPPHHGSDWRGAAAAINRDVLPDTPLVCPSPFLEARSPVWRPDAPATGFLYAHLAAYPLAGKVYAFPYADSPEAERWAEELMHRALEPSGRFAIYGAAREAAFWREWFGARAEFAEWRARGLGEFGDVSVAILERR